MFMCCYCSKEFKYESEKKRHEQSHTPQFECKACSKKFSFLSALKRHEKQHERTGSVRCNDCGRNFRDNILLKRHITYSHKGTYICSKCDAKFNSDLALISHLKTHKPSKERPFKCSYSGCTKSFNFPHHLKHHELTHTDTKQHFCTICGKGFIQAHHLKSHIRRHESEHRLHDTRKDFNEKFTKVHTRKRHLITDISDECSNSDQVQNIKSIEQELGEDKSKLVQSAKYETNNNVDVFSNCKSVLGKCIANGDTNCLCRQINDVTDFYDMLLTDDLEPNKSKEEVKLNENLFNESKLSSNNMCEGCECSRSDQRNISIELTNDGAVKIKDNFDFDFNFVMNGNSDLNNVPLGCKAALGKCIVSGNGDVSEDCLCAKMAVDNQTISQEIDEITPRPIMTLL